MTPFEKMALRGLWLILRMTLLNASRLSGTDEIEWARDVAEAVEEERLKKI